MGWARGWGERRRGMLHPEERPGCAVPGEASPAVLPLEWLPSPRTPSGAPAEAREPGRSGVTRAFACQSRVLPLSADCCEQVPGQGIIFASYEVFSRFVTNSLSSLPSSGTPKKREGR